MRAYSKLFPDLPPDPKRKVGRPRRGKRELDHTNITQRKRKDYDALAAKHGIYFAGRVPTNVLTSVRWQVPRWCVNRVRNHVDENGYFTTTYNRLEWLLKNRGPILDHFKPNNKERKK